MPAGDRKHPSRPNPSAVPPQRRGGLLRDALPLLLVLAVVLVLALR